MSWILDFNEDDKEVNPSPKKDRELLETGATTRKSMEVIRSEDSVIPPVGVVNDWQFRESDWIIDPDKPIAPPPGFHQMEFNKYVDKYVSLYKATGRHPRVVAGELLRMRAHKDEVVRYSMLVNTQAFKEALRMRGVSIEKWSDDPKKVQALALLTDPLARGTFEGKLKRLGLNSQIWDSWLADPELAQQFRNLTEQNFKKRQGEVNLRLQSMALGDGARALEAIKYYNEVSGRHDPARRQQLDIQQFTQGVIDIITSEIKDDELLMKIASRLALLTGANGVFNS